MSQYKISVEIQIEECEEAVDKNPVEQADGSFQLVISDKTASSIDACEQALLQTQWPAIRKAISEHLTALSKKKPKAMPLSTPRGEKS